MPREFILRLAENSVRLTPDGEVVVIDAIKALSECDNAEEIWQRLQNEHPEIASYCKRVHFSNSNSVLVADNREWGRIEPLLFDYILTQSLSR
jgi:hypothetical protein